MARTYTLPRISWNVFPAYPRRPISDSPEETLKPVSPLSVLPESRAVVALMVFASLLAAVPCRGAIPAAQRSALISIYNSTGGPGWTNRTGWLGKAGTECSWSGVSCDSAATTVTQLLLSNNGLAGSLPSSIGSFPALQSLEAESNSLTSALPHQIGLLANLRTLRLGPNGLPG